MPDFDREEIGKPLSRLYCKVHGFCYGSLLVVYFFFIPMARSGLSTCVPTRRDEMCGTGTMMEGIGGARVSIEDASLPCYLHRRLSCEAESRIWPEHGFSS